MHFASLISICLSLLFASLSLAGETNSLRVAVTGQNAFSLPVPVLDRLQRRAFAVGNSFFNDNWVAAPSSAKGRDGLGPLFNAKSCSACHLRDGRSEPDYTTGASLVFRINPHPEFGTQIQHRALPGIEPEATIGVATNEVTGHYRDRTPYTLQRLILTNSHGLAMDARVGLAIIGMGLLEAVPDDHLESLADPADADGDGISGRVHRTPHGIGRFGWKASQPTVRRQVAAAFHEDIGITSPLHPEEAWGTDQKKRFADLPSGSEGGDDDQPELNDHKLDRVTFYTSHIAVPEPAVPAAEETPQIKRGRELFTAIGCAACHRPELPTRADAAFAPYRSRTIAPYTDLLLHDMGPGLDAGVGEGDAQPSEWRTPPLWGIGHLQSVNGHTRLLHDGRARSVEEAILWHGGEASKSRDRFRRLEPAERAALLDFVENL